MLFSAAAASSSSLVFVGVGCVAACLRISVCLCVLLCQSSLAAQLSRIAFA